MKISEAFPSQYLKADDLPDGANVTVTIKDVEWVELGQKQERKMALTFVGKKKMMILNKTNASVIAKLYGDETDAWVGQRITLMARDVEFQGDVILALRVSTIKPNPAPKAVKSLAEEFGEEKPDGGDEPF